jgi:bifunctional non-homologous end joining protein LigD
MLAQVIASAPSGQILMSETISVDAGVDLMRHACEIGLGASWQSSRTRHTARAARRAGSRCDVWRALNFPVIGYVPAKPNSIAAIRLARREAGGLVYAGKAGTGFTMKTAQDVRKRLEPLMRRTPPTAKPLRKRDTVWVEPKLSARIEFRGVTGDGMLRHPSFKGLVSE